MGIISDAASTAALGMLLDAASAAAAPWQNQHFTGLAPKTI